MIISFSFKFDIMRKTETKMKLLRKKQDIINWLEKYNVKGYELIKDSKYGYVVNVDGDVRLEQKNLEFIEVKFNEIIYGDFNCSHNNLKSLYGCPEKIATGSFFCAHNNLSTLEYAPLEVGAYFHCAVNQIVSLKGCPKYMVEFDCSHNLLETLKHGPIHVLNDYICSYNLLKNLNFLPKNSGNDYINCSNNPDLGGFQIIFSRSEILKVLKIMENKDKVDGMINHSQSEVKKSNNAKVKI